METITVNLYRPSGKWYGIITFEVKDENVYNVIHDHVGLLSRCSKEYSNPQNYHLHVSCNLISRLHPIV